MIGLILRARSKPEMRVAQRVGVAKARRTDRREVLPVALAAGLRRMP